MYSLTAEYAAGPVLGAGHTDIHNTVSEVQSYRKLLFLSKPEIIVINNLLTMVHHTLITSLGGRSK